MRKGKSVSVESSINDLKYLSNRTPSTSALEAEDSFAVLSEYRDGAIYVTHYAGYSEWECHRQGDEIVFLLEGETMLIFLEGGKEKENKLNAGELIVVPKATWHRFESPNGVKVLTVTPQPTEHSVGKPENA